MSAQRYYPLWSWVQKSAQCTIHLCNEIEIITKNPMPRMISRSVSYEMGNKEGRKNEIGFFSVVFYSFNFTMIAVVRISPFQLDAVHNHFLVFVCSIVMQQIVLIIIACQLSVLVLCSLSLLAFVINDKLLDFFSNRTDFIWAMENPFCYHW